ncbi:hypothetical protein ACQ86N_36505 [Puia sp. P3]|uniref:hypothetical protein n=1 Tax=Puia sp. P3 TaxID=3423952 RepID=UPI003D67C808
MYVKETRRVSFTLECIVVGDEGCPSFFVVKGDRFLFGVGGNFCPFVGQFFFERFLLSRTCVLWMLLRTR